MDNNLTKNHINNNQYVKTKNVFLQYKFYRNPNHSMLEGMEQKSKHYTSSISSSNFLLSLSLCASRFSNAILRDSSSLF